MDMIFCVGFQRRRLKFHTKYLIHSWKETIVIQCGKFKNCQMRTSSNVGYSSPDSKVHGANMGPTWVLAASNGSHVGPMNLAIREIGTYLFIVVMATDRVRSGGNESCTQAKEQAQWELHRVGWFFPGEAMSHRVILHIYITRGAPHNTWHCKGQTDVGNTFNRIEPPNICKLLVYVKLLGNFFNTMFT